MHMLVVPHQPVALASLFYRAGSFVGGHVVLPLLRESLLPTGWISDDTFLAGYGFAQGMPGPLFTIASYPGAASAPLPRLGLLGGRGIGSDIPARASAGSCWTMYNPVFVSAVHDNVDAAIAVTCFVLLQRWQAPPIAIVFLCVLASILRGVVSA